MPSIILKDEFADLIREGRKDQLIINDRQSPLVVGDRITLRRSATDKLASGVVTQARTLRMIKSGNRVRVYIDGELSAGAAVSTVARREGFRGAGEMFARYVPNSGDDWHGQVIRWKGD